MTARLHPASAEETAAAASPDEPSTRDPEMRRNYVAWVGYQLFYRIGWQFKMESTMVAGLVSYLSGSASVMGMFTTVSNLGRHAAPFWATARRVGRLNGPPGRSMEVRLPGTFAR